MSISLVTPRQQEEQKMWGELVLSHPEGSAERNVTGPLQYGMWFITSRVKEQIQSIYDNPLSPSSLFAIAVVSLLAIKMGSSMIKKDTPNINPEVPAGAVMVERNFMMALPPPVLLTPPPLVAPPIVAPPLLINPPWAPHIPLDFHFIPELVMPENLPSGAPFPQ